MKTLRLTLVVLASVVILGIVGCNNRDSIISDDTELTSQSLEATIATTETTSETDPVATPTATSAPSATATPTLTTVPTSTSTPTPEVVESTSATDVQATEATQSQVSVENATTQAPTVTQAPTAASTPTSTPIPTATPEPTATPTHEPVAIDIDQSARDNGYEIVDIDMGNGTTQRVYGYFVDMSGLDARVNDYRESIGLSRLPTDTAHIEEMKIRAVEASIPGYLSHQRPNGSWGTEANIVSGTDVDDCYQRLYESDGHRSSWEDEYATTIYSVGFRRMVFDESTGTWSGGGGATVQYTDYSF